MLHTLTIENFNASLNRFSTAELESMVEKFPYFQEAHLLLAKKYQQENSYKFDQQLQLAALYTQDRDLFYTIFNQQAAVSSAPVVQEEKTPFVEVSIPAQLPEEIKTEAVVEPTQEPLVATEEPEEIKLETVEAIEPEVATTPEPVEQTGTLTTLADVSDAPEKEFSIYEPHTFDEWLKAFSQPDAVVTKPTLVTQPPEQEKLDAELERLYLSNIPLDLKELVEEETHYSKGLDKFIEEQIEKTKTRPAAKEKETASEFVTETMAKIYEQQKKYAKAIECYSRLAILHPEKNDFFAARINYLKPLL